jgi:enamine deaminase RidA (YjgF/YER057c/UK114 family)
MRRANDFCGAGREWLSFCRAFGSKKGASRMIRLLCMVAALGIGASAEAAQIKRVGAGEFPIATSVEVPAGSRIVYVSGTVPDSADPAAPQGSIQRFGDTEAQTRSVLRKLDAALKAHGLGLGDVVMMRVFLVAPPNSNRMDFAGMMRGYSAFFGTAEQPNKPARSTMQVSGLVDPGWLVEIEVTAAK